MPLRTTVEPAASLPKQISGPASLSTPGVYREWLLVVCAQALFACISLHNRRLNQPNSLHRSRSSNNFFFPLRYNIKGPHQCALVCCPVTSLSGNDVSNEQLFSKHV
jgi:hypothetical protein